MKILFLTRLFYPHIGGVEKHVYEISKKLIDRGYQITIVAEHHDKQIARHQTYEKMDVHRIPVKNSWFKKVQIWWWLLGHLRLLREVDIVHCHDVFYWYLPFRFLFPRKKVYTTFHGYEGNDIPQRKAILMHKAAETLSFGNICVGDYLKKWYGTNPTFLTYGAITFDKKASMKHLKGDTFHATFIGRLEEETGIMIYLRAIRILKQHGVTIHLTVLGDGSLRDVCEDFSSKNDIDVVYKGFLHQTKQYISSADFLFVSRYLSILESFNQKRFVFAVYNNPIKEDYLRLALFAHDISIVKDEFSLASEIQFYLQNKHLLVEKITRAYKWVENQTWDELVDQYEKVWGRRRAFM